MIIFYQNLIDASGVVITPLTQNANFPAANLTNYFRKNVYQTLALSTAENVTFDLLTAQAVTSLILLDTTFINGDIINLQSSPDNATWTTQAAAIPILGPVVPAGNPALTLPILATFGSVTARYWRVVITKADSGVRQIGRLFLGAYYQTLEPADYAGADIQQNDPSVTVESAAGNEWTDLKQHWDSIDLKFSTSPDAQVAMLQQIFSTVGTAVPIFIQPDTSGSLTMIYYCRFSKQVKRGVQAWDGQFYWNTSLSFKELI